MDFYNKLKKRTIDEWYIVYIYDTSKMKKVDRYESI